MTRKSRRVRSGANEPPDDAADGLAPETVLCGYRLVRVLAHGAESTTWLAMPANAGSGQHDTPDAPQAVSAAVELTRFAVSAAGHPGAAFDVFSPYLQCAVDMAASDDGGLVLITERTECTLAALLARRRVLPLGEAVTILAPTAIGLAALHRAGFIHGALSSATVALTPDGKPLLTGLADASEKAQPGSHGDGARLDLEAFGTLLRQVLGSCAEADSDAVSSLLRWVDRTIDDKAFFAQLDLRLFALAEPLPVDLTVLEAPSATQNPTDTVSDATDVTLSLASGTVERRRRRPSPRNPGFGWLSRLAAGTGIDSLADIADSYSLTRRVTARTAGIGGWASRALTGRATVVVVTVTVTILGVWGGLTLIPDSGRAADRSTPPSPSQAASASVALSEAESAALAADDPAAALAALLTVRARCLAGGRTDCVALFDEPGSAAEATDLHTITTNGDVRLGWPLGADPVAPAELLHRTGNAALFRVSDPVDSTNQPVLVLVMKTNTGWRVRDLSEPDDVPN